MSGVESKIIPAPSWSIGTTIALGIGVFLAGYGATALLQDVYCALSKKQIREPDMPKKQIAISLEEFPHLAELLEKMKGRQEPAAAEPVTQTS